MIQVTARNPASVEQLIYRLVCCLVALLLPVSAQSSDSDPGTRSNVLLIMADDLGFNDLAINNDNRGIDTPNLDQLDREGVRFTRHYAHAVCSPARAALLTGQYPERHGYLPNGRGISSDVITLPERLAVAKTGTSRSGTECEF